MTSRKYPHITVIYTQNRSCTYGSFLLLAALALLCSSCCRQAGTAAWVIRHDVDTTRKITEICSAAKQAGFDELLVQVRGRADAYYLSDIAPWPESLAGAPAGFDPLSQAIDRCAPLSIHAWLNVYYLWGDVTPPKNPTHPGSPDQPWILSDDGGRSLASYSEFERKLNWLEGVYADPASPEYRKLFVEVVRELVSRYAVSGIHLDFIRYPGPSFGRGGALGRKYTREMGVDPRLLPDHFSRDLLFNWLNGRQSPADRVLTTAALYWKEMRAGEVSALLRDVRAAIKKDGRKNIRLSAAVFPDSGQAYLDNGQDWRTWAAEELVDSLYPMVYFGNTDRVGAQLLEVATGAGPDSPVALWAGLGAYIKSVRRIGEEARIARNSGYKGIALFSVGHLLHDPRELADYTQVLRGPVNVSGYSFPPL